MAGGKLARPGRQRRHLRCRRRGASCVAAPSTLMMTISMESNQILTFPVVMIPINVVQLHGTIYLHERSVAMQTPPFLSLYSFSGRPVVQFSPFAPLRLGARFGISANPIGDIPIEGRSTTSDHYVVVDFPGNGWESVPDLY